MGAMKKLELLRLMVFPFIVAGILGVGCSRSADPCAGLGPDPGAGIRLNQMQMKGTHNSYHLAPDPSVNEEWDYTMPPLPVQLEQMGVRQFELDVNWLSSEGRFAVFHVEFLDTGTTCYYLRECLGQLKAWSEANPGHHPIFVYIEPKNNIYDTHIAGWSGVMADFYDALDADILAVWPRSRLVTPDEVKGAHQSVADGLAATGWPTLARSRGKALFMLLDTGLHQKHYTFGNSSLDGRAMFSDSRPGDPYGAIRRFDDPLRNQEAIRQAVRDGLLVRTRADAGDEPRAGETTRREAAFSSGAQMVSTDYPAPGMIAGYDVAIPGGTPSRCNPVNGPAGCTSRAIEDPGRRRCAPGAVP